MKKTSKLYAEQLARERGIPIASADHPIYSEGTSVVFLREKSEKAPEINLDNREKGPTNASHNNAEENHEPE